MYRGTRADASQATLHRPGSSRDCWLQDKFSLLERGSCLALASLANSLEQLGLGALDKEELFHEDLQKDFDLSLLDLQ